MPAILAVLVYLAAIGLPLYLLYRFHSQHWSWHVLAIAAAIGLGLVPIPPGLQKPGFDLMFGSLFAALLVWGAGGLILYNTHGHHEKHA
jgi:hypothetical protein